MTDAEQSTVFIAEGGGERWMDKAILLEEANRTLKAEVEKLEGFRRDVATLLLSGDDMGDGTVFNPDDMGHQHECLESLIVKARALSARDQEDTP